MAEKDKEPPDNIGDSEPDMSPNDDDDKPQKKKRGGKVIKAHGKKPKVRFDKRARGGGIHIKPSHKGLLHKDTGTKQGEPIPESKIKKAEKSSDPAVRKRAVFAENAKHWNH